MGYRIGPLPFLFKKRIEALLVTLIFPTEVSFCSQGGMKCFGRDCLIGRSVEEVFDQESTTNLTIVSLKANKIDGWHSLFSPLVPLLKQCFPRFDKLGIKVPKKNYFLGLNKLGISFLL